VFILISNPARLIPQLFEMAGASANDYKTNPQLYLSSNQQDLLLAALASNQTGTNNMYLNGLDSKRSTSNSQLQYPVVDSLDPTFASPQQTTPASNFDAFNLNESPFVDYLDGDGSFDFDNGENSDLMIGGLPGDNSQFEGDYETTDKRKSPEDDAEDPDGGGKRREPEDKTAKKPGRKPLTSEPTTKRKAQNRAAQRAFRERKEKHLKDLELKVSELEKASDATNHENGLLRAQVQRLQTELREYRKRLSLNSTSVSRSPPVTNSFSSYLTGNGTTANNFQFEFPRFGGLPGAHILDNGPLAKTTNKPSVSGAPGVSGAPVRPNSNGRSISPRSSINGSSANSPEKNTNASTNGANGIQTTGSGNLNGLFSPSLINSLSSSSPFDYNMPAKTPSNRGSNDSSATPSHAFQFNSGSSSSNSDSPSASSVSQYGGQNSSCGTSPEPSHNSPGSGKPSDNPLDTISEGYACHGNSEAPTAAKTAATDVNGIDFLANQNGGQFDPTLFGDYRESQAAIVGDGDFTGGFFNDAFPFTDFGSPFNFGDNTPAIPKPNPLEEIERQQDGGDEEVVPGDDMSQMLNCHKIWDKLANRPEFKDGSIDIDNLCSELRAKARCSESGVVVDHKDVEAALQRLPESQRT